jgi:hypothetical protein
MKSEVSEITSGSGNKVSSALRLPLLNFWGAKPSLLFIMLAPFLLNSCITSWVLKDT